MLTAYALAVLALLVLDVFLNLAIYLRPYVDAEVVRYTRWRGALIVFIVAAVAALTNLVNHVR